MANLDVIFALNRKYGKYSKIAVNAPQQRNFSLGSGGDAIEKALSSNLASLGPDYTRYFDFGLPAQVALLFIDVCGFSTRLGGLTGEKISKYFDAYYDLIIPVIYDYGGEVDKVIGDGIVCVFGPPFLSGDFQQAIENANYAAKEIISDTRGSVYTSKVAFHAGTINYYKNKTGLYNEFTMVGKPLTELFRLEGISGDEMINYFDQTPVRDFYKGPKGAAFSPAGARDEYWSHMGQSIDQGSLRGVDYAQVFRASCNKIHRQ